MAPSVVVVFLYLHVCAVAFVFEQASASLVAASASHSSHSETSFLSACFSEAFLMPCYSPLQGYKSRVGSNGRLGFAFSPKEGFRDLPASVPCGRCVGCLLERSRQWALRCVHEASLHDQNCFVTLTYDDAHLPADSGLDKSHFQDFIRSLRKRTDVPIRYYHCGEYGDRTRRPHYHACIFGFDFQDKVLFSEKGGNRLFTSDFLSRVWTRGHSSVGEVTFESAAYVARYVMKKVFGTDSTEHYTRVDPATGEWFEVSPEYTTMSRRPGIGKPWLDKFKTDVYPSDFVVVRGVKMRPPRYYDRLFSQEFPFELAALKLQREKNAAPFLSDRTPERLIVREQVQRARLSNLKRGLEDET